MYNDNEENDNNNNAELAEELIDKAGDLYSQDKVSSTDYRARNEATKIKQNNVTKKAVSKARKKRCRNSSKGST